MFCNECGVANPDGAKFCNTCGKSVTAVVRPQAPDPHPLPLSRPEGGYSDPMTPSADTMSRLNVLVIVSVLVFIGLGVYWLAAQSATAPTPRRGLGDTVHVGYWSYVITDAHWQNSLGSVYLHKQADAYFLVIGINARNDDDKASIRPLFKLVDAAGREYDESSNEVYLDDFDVLKQVNPTVTTRGHVAFDVPRGQYRLKVSGGFESSESTFVDLPLN